MRPAAPPLYAADFDGTSRTVGIVYSLFSTPDGGMVAGFGGTSFVAPRLNGIMAVVSQATGGHRLGLVNPMLYRFKRGTSGAHAALVDITAGDNGSTPARRATRPARASACSTSRTSRRRSIASAAITEMRLSPSRSRRRIRWRDPAK